MTTDTARYRDISLWMSAERDFAPRPALADDRRYDVAIIGGGYTGLWTAYYLKTLAPELAICVLEGQICGFGASGRNGGWMMAAIEGEAALLSSLAGERRDEAKAAIHGILPEVEQVLHRHGLECGYHRGGGIFAAARYPQQEHRQRRALTELRSAGFSEEEYRWLGPAELAERLQIRRPLGAIFTPHIARLNPAQLARGLAALIESLGVDIFENTPVTGVDDTALTTAKGRVHAAIRVLAVEGYAEGLAGQRRRVLPVASRIIATEPLSEERWQTIGLHNREVFSDASPVITYAQRTVDNRLAFGSRGSYRFGGRPRSDFSADRRAFAAIHALMLDCLPQLRGTHISHRWGGTLGIARIAMPHAIYDPVAGLATAGGYRGEGVGASNLMARTLADLVLERDTVLSRQPWAHCGDPRGVLRRWPPEPLRWLGYKATSLALNMEESAGRGEWPRPLARGAAGFSRLMTSLRS